DDYPFQMSGGMRQRAMIAMALAANPRVLIADEPTTALDVTIQAQVLRLIKRMQDKMNLSLILITHDLGVIAHMVERVYIMYLGRIVESGPVEEIYYNPVHPYTRDLLKSIPSIKGNEGNISSIKGSVPDSYTLPSGCSFHPRCSDYIGSICANRVPVSININDDHTVCCHKFNEGKVAANE
ncbi:MAG: ABC transporter ATP-binding protein, partial [Halanaerobiales bacterium]